MSEFDIDSAEALDWPRERRYRTSASIKAWIGLLDDTGEYFPKVYEAVRNFWCGWR